MLSKLKALAAGDPSIEFLGHVEGRKLDRLYRRCTAVVVPSLTYEISPGVIMEAFARRTPVVARNIGSIPEFAGSAGLLYDNEETLARHIQTLIQSPDRARRGPEPQAARGFIRTLNDSLGFQCIQCRPPSFREPPETSVTSNPDASS